MLREAPPTDPEALIADLAQIEDAARQAVEITGQLLTFGRRQGQKAITLDLAEFLHGHAPEITAALATRATLELDLASDTGSVRLDPVHASRLLKELAKNAAEQMPVGGGRFTLQTRAVILDAAFVSSHPGAVEGPHLRLSAHDTGPGFSAEARTRVFEPFFSTKPRGQGSGMGLAMVYGIVRQSGGTIWLEGSDIVAYLPRPI